MLQLSLEEPTEKTIKYLIVKPMKQLLVQYKSEVTWDMMHKLGKFLSSFQPPGDFLSSAFLGKKERENVKTSFFLAY